MDGPRGYYDKYNKSEKDKYHIISFMCGILKTNKQIKQNKNRVIDIENKKVIAQGEGKERDQRNP